MQVYSLFFKKLKKRKTKVCTFKGGKKGKKKKKQSIVTAKKNADGELMIMGDRTDDEKKERVNINVGYIEYMKALSDWKGDEDWTDVDKAITDGKNFGGE